MQNQKKNYQPSSKLKSFYLSCRRQLSCSNSSSTIRRAINPSPVPKTPSSLTQNNRRSSINSPSSKGNHHNESVQGNLQRVTDLEMELDELEEWFCSELARLKTHLGDTSDTTNNTNSSCSNATNDNGEMVSKLERIDFEGSYLYTFNGMNRLEGDCRDLSIQISCPALVPPEPGSNTITEVLNQMTEMGKENLMSWLLESMPMTEISTSSTKRRSHKNSNTTPNNLLEAILSSAVEKLLGLVTEGLHIQMGTKEVVKWQQEAVARLKKEARKEERNRWNGGSIIMVVLIQPRDPKIGYQPIHEMMIGLIEASHTENDEAGFSIKGVYVAGLIARRRNGEVIHNCLWCVSA